jgi:hypothetical protein
MYSLSIKLNGKILGSFGNGASGWTGMTSPSFLHSMSSVQSTHETQLGKICL